ncbi:hypothetical protein F442_06203 [Phytophthora nicotianae P10297]|uniref:SCP domain-containing protein n=1 Tax=Phytophthora nicotianae P10297 TaxID=1317064 RepID=W2ZKP8_PHYNI|nr:hypothetical protein F442_06203 [Phytophthora nicotianae P10297]
MNIKGLFAFSLVALVGMTNAETAVHEDHVARELQVADFSKKLLDAVNAKRAEKGLKAVCINAKLAKAAQVLASASTTGCSTSLTRMARPVRRAPKRLSYDLVLHDGQYLYAR